jgi:hypothetical protein
MCLSSVPGVISEQARIYRACVNGHMKPSDLCRMMFSLREIRHSIESLAPETGGPTTFNLQVVPTGNFIKDVSPDGAPLTIEHMPSPEKFDRAQESGPEPTSEEERIINNLRNEINELARRAGVSLVV